MEVLPQYTWFINLGFHITFRTVQVTSGLVVLWAEDTSMYSWSRFCTVNCRPSVSNYQLSHIRSWVWTADFRGGKWVYYQCGPLEYTWNKAVHPTLNKSMRKNKLIIMKKIWTITQELVSTRKAQASTRTICWKFWIILYLEYNPDLSKYPHKIFCEDSLNTFG